MSKPDFIIQCEKICEYYKEQEKKIAMLENECQKKEKECRDHYEIELKKKDEKIAEIQHTCKEKGKNLSKYYNEANELREENEKLKLQIGRFKEASSKSYIRKMENDYSSRIAKLQDENRKLQRKVEILTSENPPNF